LPPPPFLSFRSRQRLRFMPALFLFERDWIVSFCRFLLRPMVYLAKLLFFFFQRNAHLLLFSYCGSKVCPPSSREIGFYRRIFHFFPFSLSPPAGGIVQDFPPSAPGQEQTFPPFFSLRTSSGSELEKDAVFFPVSLQGDSGVDLLPPFLSFKSREIVPLPFFAFF